MPRSIFAILVCVSLLMAPITLGQAALASDPLAPPAATASDGGESTTDKAPANDNQKAPAKKPLLQGGVKHAEELPGLDANLQPGNVYSDDLFLKGNTASNNEWFYIPEWFAGTKHTEEEMIVYRYNYQTGEATTPMQRQLNREDSTSGYQRDRNGGIWDYKRVPRIQHVESDLVNAVLYVKKITPIAGNESQLVIKYELISVSIGKRNKKIISVVQQEQINTVTSPQPGVLRTDISAKCFDSEGNPMKLEQSVIMSKTVSPFVQKDQYEGVELRPLFRDYLLSHNLEKLVPEDLAKKN